MPPFMYVSKAVGRLVSRRNPVGMLMSSVNSGRQFEKFVQVQCLSSMVGFEAATVDRLVRTDRDMNSSIRGLPHTVQRRCFLGYGDEEEGNVLSRNYEERRVIGYSPEQLFAVVAAVDLYQDFVPWCQRSEIIRRFDDGSFDAELEIGFKFLVESYVSHVELDKPKSVKTTVSQSGIFDHLINIWEFNPGPVPGTCDVHFLVDFKFQSPLYRQVASMFFKEVVSRLVESFTGRCRLIYGPGVQVFENSYGHRV
ncbi:coenzyme Q-binding protein COQ10 homolog, mitochondrial-like [Telopea speciosissima]|uniref:coenzyme Q-binding protein COQ10 homolog, mitochondrial-like n=1 Tax=Telopea speciosissima TaxID=54955 RepID=UPI001CC76D5A|nr:coenzyme Q-binding protein COQ10 homolog, mitochondrial-like [Telopea speciosissima]